MAPKASKKSKHNWSAIRSEYVEATSEATRPTLEELAHKHGCSPSYLREKASKEHWKEAAEQFLKTVAHHKQEIKAVSTATEQAQWDQQCFRLAQGALKQVYAHLQNAIESKHPIGVKELNALALTLSQLHKLGKDALGEEIKDTEEKAADPSQYAEMSATELAQLYADRLKRPGTHSKKGRP